MNILSLVYFIFVLRCAYGQDESNDTQSETVTVTLSLGELEGIKTEFDGVPIQIFLGVPYATPPVGELRFLPPVALEPWDETRQAKEHGAACWQWTEGPFPWYDNETGYSEDCLFLNIYAPAVTDEETKHPVMFWIHGGGYTLGSNRMDVYDGRALAKEGVVVVTINYRLGVLGFITSKTDDAPGNMGMYDMVMALQWVNDHIESFGGDKSRITISGESAGSSAASALCVSPLTAGLFHQAILQSASITKHIYNKLEPNLKLANNIALKLECATEESSIYDQPAEVIQCLKEKDAEELTRATMSFNPKYTGSFSPQYGDSLLPNNAVEDIREGKFHNASILTGTLPDEGSFFITMLFADELGFFGEKEKEFDRELAEKITRPIFGNFTDKEKYVDHYLKDVADDDSNLLRKRTHTAWGDVIITCPTVYMAESYAERGHDVYFYFFNHRPSNTPWAEWLGVAHYEEVQFNFGRPLRVPDEYTPEEVALSAKMVKTWTNFIKDGNPGKLVIGEGEEIDWPKYSKEDPKIIDLNIVCYGYPKKGPAKENCDLLREYYGF